MLALHTLKSGGGGPNPMSEPPTDLRLVDNRSGSRIVRYVNFATGGLRAVAGGRLGKPLLSWHRYL